jgi:hypothetical protein
VNANEAANRLARESYYRMIGRQLVAFAALTSVGFSM